VLGGRVRTVHVYECDMFPYGVSSSLFLALARDKGIMGCLCEMK